MTWEEYDRLCEEQREKNNKWLSIFEADLIKSGLSPKTIRNHIFNAELCETIKENMEDWQEECIIFNEF